MLIYFAQETLEKMVIGDKIQIKACGCGLQLTDYPAVKVLNLDPALLEKMGLKELKGGKIQVPVTHTVPSKVMGSGIGSMHSNSGDYDIQLFDQPTVKEYGLDDLRLGDVVAIIDADATYGRIYKTGGVIIGIVVHASSVIAGHGPGVMIAMSSKDGLLVPKISTKANLKKYFAAM